MSPIRLRVACLCNVVSQEVQGRPDTAPLSICHCDTCRHASGLLCTSYYPIIAPEISDAFKVYHSNSTSTRYFCGTCGCHLFQSKQVGDGEMSWGAATGAVTYFSDDDCIEPSYTAHQHVADTQDGGLSIWMKDFHNYSEHGSTVCSNPSEILHASCACGTVRFHVTRPNDNSRVPSRDFPDLMFEDKTTPDEIKQNPKDQKWWIQANEQKYLAGTCACRSCRLASGFEIQTWAFVPRANIFFHIPGKKDGESIVPLDFVTLPPGILKTYASSSNVGREFCATCGATIFWHQKDPDDVIDISVGLFKAADGARAESWLHWWRGRVSYAEDVDYKRTGLEAKSASQLISALLKGIKATE